MLNQHYYSFLLSQIFGSFLFILAIVVMGRMYHYRKIILQLQPHDPCIPLAACIALFMGIVFVVTHNVWVWNRTTVVTVFCWLLLAKGLFWLAIPEQMLAMTKRICAGSGYYWIIVISLLIGVIFLGKGMELFILHYSTLKAPLA